MNILIIDGSHKGDRVELNVERKSPIRLPAYSEGSLVVRPLSFPLSIPDIHLHLQEYFYAGRLDGGLYAYSKENKRVIEMTV